MDDHAELVQGMKAKDPEATRVAMQQHIVHSGELLAAHFNARVAAETDNESMYSCESDDPRVTGAGFGLNPGLPAEWFQTCRSGVAW